MIFHPIKNDININNYINTYIQFYFIQLNTKFINLINQYNIIKIIKIKYILINKKNG